MAHLTVPRALRARDAVALPGPPVAIAALGWLAALAVAVLGLFGASSALVADTFQIVGLFGVSWVLMHASYGSPGLAAGLRVLAGALFALGLADLLAVAGPVGAPGTWLLAPYLMSTVGLIVGSAILAVAHARRRALGPALLGVALVAAVGALLGVRSADLLDGAVDRSWSLAATMVGIAAAAGARAGRPLPAPGWPERERARSTRLPVDADELPALVRSGRLAVHYQPIVEIPGGRIVGAEALVRLDHPRLGILTAEQFLPVAHPLGLMRQITDHVVTTACRDFASGEPAERGWWVAINLTENDIVDPLLSQRIREAASRAGLPLGRVVLEVTERALPDVQTRHALADLASIGARIALDDFGSGWSSFAQLWSLPLDLVKLDRELVTEARTGRADLLRPVVALAHHLGLEVLAEGVETQAQVAPLEAAGCRLGQGFAWGRPAPLDELVSAPA